jgi:hypothetical protein
MFYIKNLFKYKKNILLLSIIFLTHINLTSTQKFILEESGKKSKRCSKGDLKETIGNVTKDSFTISTDMGSLMGNLLYNFSDKKLWRDKIGTDWCSVGRAMGQFNIVFAKLQKRFADIIDKLVNDKGPFKSSSYSDLKGALRCLNNTKEILQRSLVCAKESSSRLSNVTMLAGKVLQEKDSIEKILNDFDRTKCLKGA